MSKLTYGIGFNSKGKHKTRIGGTQTPAYKAWYSMIARCYSAKGHARRPTYAGCTVDNRWLDYQDFAEWFYDNPYSNLGYHLDKDLLTPNNKVYSPETACFVPLELNNLLNGCDAARGDLPQGVFLNESLSKFRARVSVDGKQQYLGYFDCPQEAYQAYKKVKEAYVKEKALEWQDRIASDVFEALMGWELNPN